MRQSGVTLIFSLLILTLACGPDDRDPAPGQGDVPAAHEGEGVVSYEEGKEDSIRGRTVQLSLLWHDTAVTSLRTRGVSSVTGVDDAQVFVQGERIFAQPNGSQDRVEIEAVPGSLLGSVRDELHFALYRRANASARWERLTLTTREGEEVAQLSRASIDLAARELTYTARLAEGDRQISGVVSTGELFTVETQLAAVVVPYSTWFGLKGPYPFTLTMSCSGAPCLGHRTAPTLRESYVVPQRSAHPESGDFDPTSRAFFVSSMTRGGITRIDATGEATEVVEGREPWASLGVRVDVEARQLWNCAVRKDEGSVYPGVVHVYDLDTFALLHTFDLADLYDKGSCNDLVLAGDGIAYVTDRENPTVYALDLGAKRGEVFAYDEDQLDSSGVGTNGAAISPDGRSLIVTNYLPSRLVVIDRQDPTIVLKIELDGDAFHEALGGADGIRFIGNTLYVTFPTKVARVTPHDDSWRKAHVQMLALPEGGHSGAIVIDGDLYVTNGHPLNFVLKRAVSAFHIRRVDWSVAD